MAPRPGTSGTSLRREELLGKCAAFWSRRAGRPFSFEDGREITENVTGFFSVLVEWARDEDRETEANSGSTTETTVGED
jgi:hypothetical protein